MEKRYVQIPVLLAARMSPSGQAVSSLICCLPAAVLMTLLPERPLFRAPSPSLEVVTKRFKATPSAKPAKKQNFNYLFGQTELSSEWLAQRGRLKDLMAELLDTVRPRGDRDMLDWIAMGRAIGNAIDSAERAEEGQGVENEVANEETTAQEQADMAEPGPSVP